MRGSVRAAGCRDEATKCVWLVGIAALASEKSMRNYASGEPSATLYVKNLAKDVDVPDLLAVFGAVMPDGTRLRCVDVDVVESWELERRQKEWRLTSECRLVAWLSFTEKRT